MARKSPALTVDAILIGEEGILVIKRKNEPFKGKWALPGGFVEYGETLENAVMREIKEETGLDIDLEFINLHSIQSEPSRDPRGHVISVVYDIFRWSGLPKAADDAAEVAWKHMDDLKKEGMAFDHLNIVSKIPGSDWI